jgi:hypothetical protein
MPARLTAAGLQPAGVEMSTVLSPAVAGHLGELVGAAVAELVAWSHDVGRMSPAAVA